MACGQNLKNALGGSITDQTAVNTMIAALDLLTTSTGGNLTAGTAIASAVVTTDANKDVTALRNITATGTTTLGSTDAAAIKGIYYSGTIATTVPSITDPDIAKVDVDVSAMTFAPAVGDAVIAIPLEALPTNCRLQGAQVVGANSVQVVFGSEGGNVTGAAKNFGYLIFDLT